MNSDEYNEDTNPNILKNTNKSKSSGLCKSISSARLMFANDYIVENRKSLKPSQPYSVFKNTISPEESKWSASKRYTDHFNEQDRQNEEFSENDILYQIWENEKRPSKDVTSVNTGFSTLREDWLTNPDRYNNRVAQVDNKNINSEYYKHNQPFEIEQADVHHGKGMYKKLFKKSKHHQTLWKTGLTSKPSYRGKSVKPTQVVSKQKLSIKSKDTNFVEKRNSNTMNPLGNLDEILDWMTLEISEKNSDKRKEIKQEEENYEMDIKGLKKKLDFIHSSNCKMISKEITEIDAWNKAENQTFSKQVWSEMLNPASFCKNNTRNNIDQGVISQIPALSPKTLLLSCFATHDAALLSKLESEFSNQKDFSSGRKSHNIDMTVRDNNMKRYLKLKPNKKSNKDSNCNTKLYSRSERGSSLNKIKPKKHNELIIPNTKKLKVCRKDIVTTGHSMSIETQLNKQTSMYEWNTQQVSAVKIPANLISDHKKYQSILKDGRSIDTKKNLFPKTSKNNNGSKGKRRNNLILHNSRNPSVGDSRYSSSMITVQKPNIKSRLFNNKKSKKWGISEIHSNKSNSSMRKSCTPMYMFRNINSNLTKENSKKRKNRSKNKRVCSRKKSYNGLVRYVAIFALII